MDTFMWHYLDAHLRIVLLSSFRKIGRIAPQTLFTQKFCYDILTTNKWIVVNLSTRTIEYIQWIFVDGADVVVHSPHWAKCVRINTRTLRILMKRMFKVMKYRHVHL